MFLRFAAAIGLITAIALAAVAIEKQNLSLKRAISLQHYQIEVQQEKRCRLVLQTEQLGGPSRLMQEIEKKQKASARVRKPAGLLRTGDQSRKASP